MYKRLLIIFIIILTFILGCATYYQKNSQFQEYFEMGEIKKANQILDKNKKAFKDKNRLIHFLQKGVVLQMLGEYQESNNFFEEAYIFSEDFRKNYSTEAVSLITNPTVKAYTGEDHELVLMHYYKIINYLQLNQLNEALVECRRINNKLNLLNDRYEKRKNRYKEDAFALNLMGIIFEASGDINNAFIAYRNAYWAYEQNYSVYFNTKVPLQLKKDLLRTAYLNGFQLELEEFEETFSMKYKHVEKPMAELVFFWNNGLGPVKGEWSINFSIVKGQGGIVMFVNEEMGLNFPFPLPPVGNGTGGFGDLKFVRVAFPKYIERKPYYEYGELVIDNKTYQLELAENINEIAFKTLEDRMLREMANSLMRLAIKQVTEQRLRKQNENLGALLSIINAVTEKADTRNWQTLPYNISYARIPLKANSNKITMKIYSSHLRESNDEIFDFEATNKQTLFHVFHVLESTSESF